MYNFLSFLSIENKPASKLNKKSPKVIEIKPENTQQTKLEDTISDEEVEKLLQKFEDKSKKK
jgi:hypothetical protein